MVLYRELLVEFLFKEYEKQPYQGFPLPSPPIYTSIKYSEGMIALHIQTWLCWITAVRRCVVNI